MDKTALAEFFAQAPIMHGTYFDDDRRWCTTCMAPRHQRKFSADDPWADKTCHECTSIWPEFAQEIMLHMMDDADMDDFEDILLN